MTRAQSLQHTSQPLLRARGVSVVSPSGRALIRDLNVSMKAEQVALIGRNGVGKSTLLNVLAGQQSPHRGQVSCLTDRLLVPQDLAPINGPQHLARLLGRGLLAAPLDGELAAALDAAGLLGPQNIAPGCGFSLGERRKLYLLAARLQRPGLLLLDEPTQDLDAAGIDWLISWLRDWTGALLVVSHDRRLLQQFRQFVVIAEGGCRHFADTLDGLERQLERLHADEQRKYLRTLNVLIDKERHNETVCRRRRRKKNLGRLHEEARAPSRAQLHGKKGYAEHSQGKAAKLRQARISGVRQWALAARRALNVELPMRLSVQQLPADDGVPLVSLERVAVRHDERALFSDVSLQLGRDRVGVVGRNGAGKTTLLEVLSGQRTPSAGRAIVQHARLGTIAQRAANWVTDDSLAQLLLAQTAVGSLTELAQLLVGHKFPLALAERPLASLSPGERMRAALICLFQRSPAVELLVLDEPTYSLDFVGQAALVAGLQAWTGGLVVASHDAAFVDLLGVNLLIELDGQGGVWPRAASACSELPAASS